MTCVLRCAAFLVLSLGGYLLPAIAQVPKGYPLGIVKQLAMGNERQDFPWKVELKGIPVESIKTRRVSRPPASPPVDSSSHVPVADDLDESHGHGIPASYFQMFASRSQVFLSIIIPRKINLSGVHKLYMAARVTSELGQVLDYVYANLSPPLDPGYGLEFKTSLYARPGIYVITVVLYDGTTQQSNVWRSQFTVSKQRDTVPHLYDNFPLIEFTGKMEGYSPEVVPWFPISGSDPVQIDVIADFSQTIGGSSPMNLSLRSATFVAALLGSHLKPAKGCVRVTALNALGKEIFIDRVDAGKVDWDELREQIEELGSNTVDVGALEAYQNGPTFMRARLTEILNDASACTMGGKPPLRVVLIIAPGIRVGYGSNFRFPEKAKLEPAELRNLANCRIYYLQTGKGSLDKAYRFWDSPASLGRLTLPNSLVWSPVDYLGEMLKPVHARELEWSAILAELNEPAAQPTR